MEAAAKDFRIKLDEERRKSFSFYETPSWCVDRLLEDVRLPDGYWLDPCVGSFAIPNAVVAQREHVHFTTIDIDETHRPEIAADFLTWAPERRYHCVIMNPPYPLALEFVRHAMTMSHEVVALLRLNWLASEKRAAFLRNAKPNVYVLPNRPSFTVDGKTDGADYAWMHWAGGGSSMSGLWRVLGSTPVSLRRRNGG